MKIQFPSPAVATMILMAGVTVGVVRGVSSSDDHKPVTLKPALSLVKAQSGFAEAGKRRFIVSGGTVNAIFTLDDNMHVLYVNPDWCEREFGHAWELDMDIIGSQCADVTSERMGTVKFLLPNNFVRHFHCRICKLKKTETSTCQTAAPVVKTDTVYEKPVKP